MSNENLESIKKELIANIDKKEQDGIIENSNATLIKKLIENAQNSKEATSIAALGTTYKRTGFHFDKRLDKIENTGTIKFFKKNQELSFADNSNIQHNKLIIGDNFYALNNLLIEYKGNVDVIYIDPPYGKDSMGQYAETSYNNALTRDNLLSMLYPRLVLAKELLAEDGVIFCSIDDRNQAYVKCLFDEVFGENNFLVNLNWKKKKQPSFLAAVAGVMEYVLVYTKNRSYIKKLSIDEITDSNKPVINASNNVSERIIRKGIRVKKDIEKIDKGTYSNRTMTIEYLDDVIVKDGITQNEFRCKAKFRTDQNNIDKYCEDNLIFITKNLGLRRDISDDEKGKAKAITDLLLDWGQNQDGSDELKSIFGIEDDTNMFDNPKPTLLISNLVKSIMKQDAIVLDFFAGSGTTGEAVLALNKNDGGNRSFILCQLDENLDDMNLKNPNNATIMNQIALCNKINRPHNLAEITAERLRRIMVGKSYDGSDDFQWLKDNEKFGGSLDVYEVGELISVANNESTEGKTPFDVIDETLYGLSKFENLEDKREWVCKNFENCQKEIKE